MLFHSNCLLRLIETCINVSKANDTGNKPLQPAAKHEWHLITSTIRYGLCQTRERSSRHGSWRTTAATEVDLLNHEKNDKPLRQSVPANPGSLLTLPGWQP